MAITIIVVLTAALVIVPVVAARRYDRRLPMRPALPDGRGPVRGEEFWQVDSLIREGRRGSDARTRNLVREEINWRLTSDKRLRPMPNWLVATNPGLVFEQRQVLATRDALRRGLDANAEPLDDSQIASNDDQSVPPDQSE